MALPREAAAPSYIRKNKPIPYAEIKRPPPFATPAACLYKM
jgi:hypothetical protein